VLDGHVLFTEAPGSALLEVIGAEDATDPGLWEVRIFDVFRTLLRDASGSSEFRLSCAHAFDIQNIGPVQVQRLPVTVNVSRCGANPLTFGPFGDPSDPSGEPRELCSALMDTPPSPACTASQDALAPLREAFRIDCDAFHSWAAAVTITAAAASTWTAAAAALYVGAATATATLFGAPAGGALLDLAIIATMIAIYLWSIVGIFQAQVEFYRSLVTAATEAINDALDRVRRVCCPSHVILSDTSIPTCT
jgi:hypothetical protein